MASFFSPLVNLSSYYQRGIANAQREQELRLQKQQLDLATSLDDERRRTQQKATEATLRAELAARGVGSASAGSTSSNLLRLLVSAGSQTTRTSRSIEFARTAESCLAGAERVAARAVTTKTRSAASIGVLCWSRRRHCKEILTMTDTSQRQSSMGQLCSKVLVRHFSDVLASYQHIVSQPPPLDMKDFVVWQRGCVQALAHLSCLLKLIGQADETSQTDTPSLKERRRLMLQARKDLETYLRERSHDDTA